MIATGFSWPAPVRLQRYLQQSIQEFCQELHQGLFLEFLQGHFYRNTSSASSSKIFAGIPPGFFCKELSGNFSLQKLDQGLLQRFLHRLFKWFYLHKKSRDSERNNFMNSYRDSSRILFKNSSSDISRKIAT